MTTRIHQPCGEPMNEGVFAHNDRTPQYRSQPIRVCPSCSAWEPSEDWKGSLPTAWNGTVWTE